MADPIRIFDRALVRKRRDRAAPNFSHHDFLVRESAERLADRLQDITRTFPLALDLGCHTGELADTLNGRGGIETLVQCDLSPAMARRAAMNGRATVAADDEWLPFAEGSFDLVLSNLSLHWVNDLPGTLVQIRRILKPDGLFLGAMLGGETLKELRRSLAEAEVEVEGGLSPRVSPFADVRDLGSLLQRAGFALPVADADRLTLAYAEPLALLAELRAAGETNCVLARARQPLRRGVLAEAMARLPRGANGRVGFSLVVMTLTGWAPAASQPRPLRPGSATTRLAAALATTEQPAGERPGGLPGPSTAR
jgi:SAM-dependent methyltransferase